MNFNISSWAIKRPIPILVLFLALTFFGAIAFIFLPINAYPKTSLPVVEVDITQSGASPDEIERSITRWVEDAASGLSGVRHIYSTITDGSSVTIVEFQYHVDPDRAFSDVRNAVIGIQDQLPQDIEEPIFSHVDYDFVPLGYFVVEDPNMTSNELSWLIDDEIRGTLLSVPGAEKIERIGGANREIRVNLKPEKLQAYNVSASQVNEAIKLANVNTPAGIASLFGNEQTIRIVESKESVKALGQMPITLGDERKVRLSDIADIKDGSEEVRNIARLNGKEVVGFTIYNTKGYSDTEVLAGVDEALAEIMAEHEGLKVERIHSTVNSTYETYEVTMQTLIEGALLTIIIVFVFLRNWRSTLIAAIALPLSILPTFAIMYLLDYTLNIVTLVAITLVIGILVDDAIVEIENIEKHLLMGKRPFKAALDASKEISFAVIAITLTIVAVFIPVSFMENAVGQYFISFGITVSAAVLSSLLVARLVTPLLAAYLLVRITKNKEENTVPSKSKGITGLYLRLISTALAHRKLSVVFGILFLISTMSLVVFLPSGYLPKSDLGYTQLDITYPPSYTIEHTDQRLNELAAMIKQHTEVKDVFVTAGIGREIYKGKLLVVLKHFSERDLSQVEFEVILRNELSSVPDMKYSFLDEYDSHDVSIILTAKNDKYLEATAHELKTQMKKISSIANVQINAPLKKTELEIKLNAMDAARLGVTAQAVGDMLRIATIGDTNDNLSRFNLPDRQLVVRVSMPQNLRQDLEILKHLPVATEKYGNVPLKSVAQLNYADGPASIERLDRKRKISIDADLLPNSVLGEALDEVDQLPILKNLPQGVKLADSEDTEDMEDMFEGFVMALIFGIVLVLFLLILLFKDFLQPITIFVAMPFSFGGAFIALLLTGKAIDMASIIGILMLMGIVLKNSILIVDFIIDKKRQGMSRYESIIQSVRERSRPIVMTTIAMIAGMTPAVLAGGAGSGYRSTMAITVIGGLIVSTVLSLVFVPVVYSLIDDIKVWLLPKLAKLTTVTDEDRELAEKDE